MRLQLPVVRLQVQRDRMKPGLPPRRRYTPTILAEVTELRVTADGVIGIDAAGTEYLDVHNANHPRTRGAKRHNGISIMTTGDYAALRDRYGSHLTDGIAGESILLDYAPGLAHRPLPDTLTARAAAGDRADLLLEGVHVAKPCVEFSRFCLRRDDFEVDDVLRQTLKDLDDGARGYKMSAPSAPSALSAADGSAVRVGDIVICELPD